MRIIIFPSSFLPVIGGVQEVSYRLAKEFIKKGHEVTVITQRYPRQLKAAQCVEDIPVYRILFPNLFPANYNPRPLFKYVLGLILAPISLVQLVWLLKRKMPEIVYVHFLGISCFYLLACRIFLKFRLVVTLHGDDVEGLPFLNRFNKWLFITTCNNAGFVTACSKDIIEKGRVLCPSIVSKSMQIHNGLEMNEFIDIKPYEHVRPFIFSAGRFVHKKGFDVLIRAFHLLVEKGHNLNLILAGEGPELNEYIKLAENLKIKWFKRDGESGINGQRLIFWGWADRNEMKSLISGSRMLVVPSRKEPFGLVILEAMASGTAVVATNVGGIPEIVLDGSGLLIPADNVVALAQAIENLNTQEDLRETLKRNGLERVKEFSWAKSAESYLNLSC